MKTKHILTAMVLPTLLAACTADEIVENNNNAVAKNRAQVEAVTFAAGEGSRLAYENGAWDWEDTDKFLLLQADNGNTYTGSTVLPGGRFAVGVPSTGYEYKKDEDGLYRTSASVMEEGLYWGYAPSFNKQYKGYVKFDLPTAQFMHVKGVQDTYCDPELAALITPLYEVSALNEENYNNLPLGMINFYSTLVMPLKNNTEDDITINQIVFETEDPITVAGRINTGALSGFIMASDDEEWAPAVNFDDDDENDYDDQVDMLKAMAKTNLIAEYNKTLGDKQTSAIVLNLDGYVLKAGKTENFYMLIPASPETEITYSIAVVAKEGLVEINSSFASNYMVETKINHNATKAAFGVTNKNAARAFVIDEGDFTEMGDSYYVTDADEMMRILDEDVNGTISVYNVGDWAINADLAKAIKNSDAFVIFKNEIKVEGAALTADKALELVKVAFNKVTVAENTKVDFKLGKYEDEDGDDVDAFANELAVEAGAEVKLTSGKYRTIKNEGILDVTSAATVKFIDDASIENAGVLNLVENNEIETITLKGGELNYKVAKTGNTWATSNVNVGFELAANAKITVAEGVTLTNEVDNDAEWRTTELNSDSETVTKHAISVVNNGTIMLGSENAGNDAGSMTVWGTLTNNGEILKGYNATLTIAGTATNAADAKIKVKEFVNYGTLTNNGDLRSEGSDSYGNNNFGLIIAGAGSRTDIDNKNASNLAEFEDFEEKIGRIDNSAAAVVKADVEQVVYYEVEDADETDLEAVRYKSRGINTLRVTGTLTLNRNFGGEEANSYWKTEMAALTTLELADDAEIEVYANDVEIGIPNIIFEGDATISGTQISESALTLVNESRKVTMTGYSKAVAATAKEGYVLTIDGVSVKLGDAETYSTATTLEWKHIAEKTSGTQVNKNITVKVEDGEFPEPVGLIAGTPVAL